MSIAFSNFLFVAASPSPSPVPPQVYWAAIVVGGIYVLYVVFNPFRRRRRKDPLAKPPPATGLAQQRNVERQMQNLLVELSEMARQVTAQLDTRAAKLQALIDDADARLAALRAVAETSPPVAYAQTPAEVPIFRSSPTNYQTPASADEYATTEVPMFRTPTAEPTVEPTAGSPSQNDVVYTLADRGRSVPEIARELNRPRGEVDLILLLRPPT